MYCLVIRERYKAEWVEYLQEQGEIMQHARANPLPCPYTSVITFNKHLRYARAPKISKLTRPSYLLMMSFIGNGLGTKPSAPYPFSLWSCP